MSETSLVLAVVICIHVYDIAFYIVCVFYSGRIRTLVATATCISIDL